MELESLWSVVPALLAVVLAFSLRKVVVSLGAGVLLGACMAAGWEPWAALLRLLHYLEVAFTEGSHPWILMFALGLGGFMRLLRETGGGQSLGQRVAGLARTRRGGQLAAWGLGLIFFFDDYANTLFVGSSMGPAARRLRLSKEKLAFIIDATAAPVASLAPLSSWIAMELGLIAEQLTALGIARDPYGVFLATIPYRFYPLLMLVFGLLVAWTGRDFGPMATAEQRAQRGPAQEDLATEAASTAATTAGPLQGGAPGETRLRGLPPLLGLAGLFGMLYWTGRSGALAAELRVTLANVLSNASSSKALVCATWLASLSGLAVYGRGRPDVWRIYREGVVGMAQPMAVLALAWALGAVCHDLGTAQALVGLLGDSFAPALLPTMVFLLSSIVSFATGTSWGTMGILFPLAVPLAHELAPSDMSLLIGTIAAVLSGSVFGDHCSPISDTTIMSALAVECDQLAHVQTQLPYALLVGVVSIGVAGLPVAWGWYSAPVGVLLGSLALALCLVLLGKRLEQPVSTSAEAAPIGEL